MRDPRITQNRVPSQQIVDAAPIVINENDPDLIFLNASKVLTTKGGKINYKKYVGTAPSYQEGSSSSAVSLSQPVDNTIKTKDTPQLTDIESITYEQYYDAATKAPKYKAIITIKNSSYRSTEVQSVDARTYDPNAFAASSGSISSFIAPNPTKPLVVFSRIGTAIAWGWNNVGGLNSYTSVSYEWIISESDASNAATLDDGTKEYSDTSSYTIGSISNKRTYRVSSGDGDTLATASSRWLRVRAVVLGTDGNTYNSGWSTPV